MCVHIESEYNQTDIKYEMRERNIDDFDKWKDDLEKFLEKIEYGENWKKFDYITEDIDKNLV